MPFMAMRLDSINERAEGRVAETTARLIFGGEAVDQGFDVVEEGQYASDRA